MSHSLRHYNILKRTPRNHVVPLALPSPAIVKPNIIVYDKIPVMHTQYKITAIFDWRSSSPIYNAVLWYIAN